MKKIIIIILLAFTLVGCKPKDQTPIKMIVPFGSPQLSQLYMQSSTSYHVDIIQGADPLVAAFGSKSHDVIFAPTNLGAKMYQAKPDYILIAVVVWGNFYLVTEDESIDSFLDLQDKEVIVFGQNQTSDIIIKYIMHGLDINFNITYVDSVQTATEMYLMDTNKIVMVAEPSLSKIKSLKEETKVIDLQTLYLDVHGSDTYPQAGVFVKADLSQQKIDRIITDLSNSIETLNLNISDSAHLAITLGVNLTHPVLMDAILNSNIRYQSARSSKPLIEDYFMILLEYNPLLIGGELPNDGFYGGSY